MENVVKPYAAAFEKYAANKKEILCLTADLTSSCEVDLFRDKYPEQCISCGMAEQNMISFSAGLAMQGYRPFIHTFGVFLYRRPFEQLVCSVAYSNRKVRLMSFLPGISTPGGATHQAIEDVAVLRAVPNMTILETGDATEVETVLPVADAVDGPVYVRIWRGIVPRLFSSPFKFNTLRTLNEGEEILVVSSGICTQEAMKVTKLLQQKNIYIRHIHASTLKPFNADELLSSLHNIKGIITLENHTVVGGLGSIVAEILAENMCGNIKLIRLGLQDVFSHGASLPYLMEEHGMDAMALLNAIESLLDKKLGFSKEDINRHSVMQEKNKDNAHEEAL